jgi:hypothetical protein
VAQYILVAEATLLRYRGVMASTPILPALFGHILIPQAVTEELKAPRKCHIGDTRPTGDDFAARSGYTVGAFSGTPRCPMPGSCAT